MTLRGAMDMPKGDVVCLDRLGRFGWKDGRDRADLTTTERKWYNSDWLKEKERKMNKWNQQQSLLV